MQSPAEGEAALAWLVEDVNQWVAGAEQLRWTFMRKPLDVAATRAAETTMPALAAGALAAVPPSALPAAPLSALAAVPPSALPDYPRRLSVQTAATWAARWATLRDTAVLGVQALPSAAGVPVPFETLLRGRGLNPLADRLVAATDRVDRALAGLDPASPAKVLDAAAALGELTRLVQDELARAIDVRMGFSDADGD